MFTRFGQIVCRVHTQNVIFDDSIWQRKKISIWCN